MWDTYGARSFFSSITIEAKDSDEIILLDSDSELTTEIERYLIDNFKLYIPVSTSLVSAFKESLQILAKNKLLNPESILIITKGCWYDFENFKEGINPQKIAQEVKRRAENIISIKSNPISLQGIVVDGKSLAENIVEGIDLNELQTKVDLVSSLEQSLEKAKEGLWVVLYKMSNERFISANGIELHNIINEPLSEAIKRIKVVYEIIGKEKKISSKEIRANLDRMEDIMTTIEKLAGRKENGSLLDGLKRAFNYLKSFLIKPEVKAGIIANQGEVLKKLKSHYKPRVSFKDEREEFEFEKYLKDKEYLALVSTPSEKKEHKEETDLDEEKSLPIVTIRKHH